MIDFGLARLYIDSKTGQHIPFATGKNIAGTFRYISANAHCGMESSRRDDLITLGYVIIELYKGRLPWSKYKDVDKKARYRRIARAKLKYSNNIQLCANCPEQFLTYMNYVMKMSFDQAPDYAMLKQLVKQAAQKAKVDIFDNVFDWSLLLSRAPNTKMRYDNLDGLYDMAKSHRFNTFADVKAVIELAYKKLTV